MTGVEVDLDHGGRWTSLRAGGREWLWQNPTVYAAARTSVRPGDAFVDAGGGEECWPTVRGRPDHGAAWSRPWSGDASEAWVSVPELGTLRRRISAAEDVRIDYTISAEGAFLHTVHLLLDLSPAATITVAAAQTMIILDDPDPSQHPHRRWPSGLDRLGPDDGTAVCALLPGVRSAVITDGDDRLELSWDCPERPELCSLLLWRNLRGWPAPHPYRSIGVEPMIGRAADLSGAAAEDCAGPGVAGDLDWSLRVRGVGGEATGR